MRVEISAPPTMSGLDFRAAALAQAKVNFEQVERTLQGNSMRGCGPMPMSMRVRRQTSEHPPPFPDHSL